MTDTHYYEGKKITFPKNGLNISALVFYPEHIDYNAKYPAIVVTHPGGGVKEQVASLYAWNLSRSGYVTIAFDAAHHGESDGIPRYLEDPASRVEDIRAAVDYLTTLSFVDRECIGAMGICAGGGYTMSAIQTDFRIKAAAGISSWNTGDWVKDGFPPREKNCELVKSLKMAAEQRIREANGEKPLYVGYVPNSPDEIDENTPVIMREASEYYRTERCAYPTSVNKMAVQSLDRLAAFDAFQYLDTVSPRPILLIIGGLADTKHFSEDAYSRAKEPKELFVIDNATHVDLYDVPKYVEQAISKLVSFFDSNLKNS